MKRLVALVMVLMLLCFAAGCAEREMVTYEDVISGKCNGLTVTMLARAVPISPYRNLRYLWAVEKKDGTFEIVDNSESRWAITEEKYERASEMIQDAIDDKDTLVLEVSFSNIGTPKVLSFTLPGERTYSEEQRLWFGVMWGVLIGAVVLLIVVFRCTRNMPYKPPAKPIRTKFIDGSHIVIKGQSVHDTTFMVYYDDGSQRAETVRNHTGLYDKYMKMLDI